MSILLTALEPLDRIESEALREALAHELARLDATSTSSATSQCWVIEVGQKRCAIALEQEQEGTFRAIELELPVRDHDTSRELVRSLEALCQRFALVASPNTTSAHPMRGVTSSTRRCAQAARRWQRPSHEDLSMRCADCTRWARSAGAFAPMWGACLGDSLWRGQMTAHDHGCAARSLQEVNLSDLATRTRNTQQAHDSHGCVQCGGCALFIPLAPPLSGDWGTCAHPASSHDGALRFEHEGCLAHRAHVQGWPGASPAALDTPPHTDTTD